MTEPTEQGVPADLAERVDSALQAFWRGDAGELEHLVDSGEVKGAQVGALFQALLAEHAVPITGLVSSAQVGSYRIIREIARGGMGVVYEAEQERPRRRVALKVLAGPQADEQHRRLFRREIQTLARLRHEAIATIFEAGQTGDGQQFFTMELVDGVPLDSFVRKRELPPPARLDLFARICDAVEYAHSQGVIHRDLKPANILVDDGGHPRILDFGLARLTGVDVTTAVTLADVGRVVGTVAYMSPEQARGDPGHVDRRSDVYALGVILYELLTDQPPYDLHKILPHEALRVICEQPPRRPSTLLRTLRGDLETIVLKALEKEPGWRYPSAGELAADVRRYLAGEPVCARPPSGLYVLRKKLFKHRRGLAAAGIVAAIGLLSAGGALGWRAHRLAREEARALAAARLSALGIQAGLERGNYRLEYGTAEQLFEHYPDLPDARLVMAQAEFREPGGVARQTAIFRLVQGLRREPERWEFASLLADYYRIGGRPDLAEPLEAMAERSRPDTADAWYLASLATLDVDRAFDFARCAVGCADAGPLAWERYTRLCELKEDWDEVLRGATRLIAFGQRAAEWRRTRGSVHLRCGRHEQAIAEFEFLIRNGDWAQSPHVLLGHARRRMGDYAAAVADYTTAIDLKTPAAADRSQAVAGKPGRMAPPLHGTESFTIWSRYHRAVVRWMLGETERAIEDCYALRPLSGRPTFADARLYLMLRQQGRAEEAADVLRRAIAESASDDLWLKAIFRCLAGELTADELIADALEKKERARLCEAYYYAGEVFRLRGVPHRARECFERCVQTGVVFDPNYLSEPMSEYDLAQWRLAQSPRDHDPQQGD